MSTVFSAGTLIDDTVKKSNQGKSNFRLVFLGDGKKRTTQRKKALGAK